MRRPRIRVVVRLKGGDPMLFGRAQEEIAALEAAGVRYEVVPGITAALAASAQIGISLTQRGLVRTVSLRHAARRRGRGRKRMGTKHRRRRCRRDLHGRRSRRTPSRRR